MGLAEKHAYRFKFLQSEEWKTIRAEQLAKHDARCAKCGFRSLSNDVHHFQYLESRAMAEFVGADVRQKLTQPLKFQWGIGGAEQHRFSETEVDDPQMQLGRIISNLRKDGCGKVTVVLSQPW